MDERMERHISRYEMVWPYKPLKLGVEAKQSERRKKSQLLKKLFTPEK